MRHINLDLLRVTEAAAIAASKWVGSGNKEQADKAATDAMRRRLNNMDFAGKIVIGEGEKDNSYGLFSGECVGIKGLPNCGYEPSASSAGEYEHNNQQRPALYEIAVDPIEGTTPTVTSGPEAIACLAIAHEGCMRSSPTFYMQKLAYGKEIKQHVTLSVDDPIDKTVTIAAKVLGKPVEQVMVCVLNRPRHHQVITTLRNMGVRIKLIQDCDVSGAIATCRSDSGVDLMYGIGGSPEAVLTATAIKCLGGDFQAKEVKGDKPNNIWIPYGEILSIEDLVKGSCVFVATGITNGSILKGVRFTNRKPITNSVFMRSESQTVRWVTTEHGN